MRFVIREQEYERLIASGRLRYGSGAHEHWRLTEAVDGYRVLRIDLDRRETAAASSTLIHLLLAPDGRLERLKLRHFAPVNSVDVDVLINSQVVGDVTGNSANVSRKCAGKLTQAELILPAGFGLLPPAISGLALFVARSGNQARPSAIELDEQRLFEPANTTLVIKLLGEEKLTVTGQLLTVRSYLIRRNETNQTLWLDEHGLPVRLESEDGRQAIEDRYVRHR